MPAERPDPVRARRWAFALMAVTTAAVALVVALVGIAQSDGVISYAVDDAYIHLAIARNLARAGTWGVVPGHFESASSSPGWTLLLAPATWLPAAAWAPLVLNLAAGAWLLWQVAGLGPVRRSVSAPGPTRFVWMLYPIVIGLVPLMLIGMEHTLHAAIVVATLILLGRIIVRDGPGATLDRSSLVMLGLLVAAGTATRPETSFVALGVAAALWIHGRGTFTHRSLVTATLVMGVAAVIPLAAMAAVDRAFGQDLLPNSVVAKTLLGGGGGLTDRLGTKLVEDPLLVAVAVLGAVALVLRPGRRAATVLTAMLVATGCHVLLADVGWMQRYQAYLIIGLTIGLIDALGRLVPTGHEGRLVVAALLLVAPRLALTVNTSVAMSNVAHMQARMAEVLASVADDRAVAVNDLGWVAWAHEGPLVDLAGLGSHEILALRRQGHLDRARVGEIFEREGVEVMVVYDTPFSALVPAGWVAATRTCVDETPFVVSAPCITWYAPDAEAAATLRDEVTRHATDWGGAMQLEPVEETSD